MYETNYALIESKIFDIEQLEIMIPWERKVYTGLHIKNIEQQKERMRQAKRKKR